MAATLLVEHQAVFANPHSCVDVKLIDFAHWYESEGGSIKRDESSIKGIKSLLRSFQWVESLVKSRAYTENT